MDIIFEMVEVRSMAFYDTFSSSSRIPQRDVTKL